MNQLPRLVLFRRVGECLMSQLSAWISHTQCLFPFPVYLGLIDFPPKELHASQRPVHIEDINGIYVSSHCFHETLFSPSSHLLLSSLLPWLNDQSFCLPARLAPGSHLAHHSGRWRASIRGSLLSQNFKHRESKRRLKCCQTMIHSAQPRLTLLHQTQFSTIQTIHHCRYITQIILELPFHQNFPHSTYHSIQYNSFLS